MSLLDARLPDPDPPVADKMDPDRYEYMSREASEWYARLNMGTVSTDTCRKLAMELLLRLRDQTAAAHARSTY
jgi:hypothetical protein